jgi:hypothetical protein
MMLVTPLPKYLMASLRDMVHSFAREPADEVTSGLDSFTAHKLIQMLKQIALDHQRIMITSIHQPSQTIFAQMDRLLLIAEGRSVFSGPAEDVENVLVQCRVPRPAQVPMADYLLQLCNEPHNLRTIADYFAGLADEHDERDAFAGAGGSDLTASSWVHSKPQSRSVPIVYRLGILVRSDWTSLWSSSVV